MLEVVTMPAKGQRAGDRVLGPYRHSAHCWRVIVWEAGERQPVPFATEAEALRFKVKMERAQAAGASITVDQALEKYRQAQLASGRWKQEARPGGIMVSSSLERTIERIRYLLTDGEMALTDLTKDLGEQLYEDLRGRQYKHGSKVKTYAVTTTLNALADAKTFTAWCRRKELLKVDPLADIEPIGVAEHGKPQLTIDEARKFVRVAVGYADAGEEGATMCLVALLMNLRANEIVKRPVRQLDADGALLRVEPDVRHDEATGGVLRLHRPKTRKGRRLLEVPVQIQPYLRRLTERKGPHEPLFGAHSREYVSDWAVFLCEEAGVPRVTAHGLRGTYASLALEAGETPQLVADSLGHDSFKATTERSYATPGAVHAQRSRRVVEALLGPRSNRTAG